MGLINLFALFQPVPCADETLSHLVDGTNVKIDFPAHGSGTFIPPAGTSEKEMKTSN